MSSAVWTSSSFRKRVTVAVCICLRSYGHWTPGRTSNARTTSTGLALVAAGSDRAGIAFSLSVIGRSGIGVSFAGRDPPVVSGGGSLERDGEVSVLLRGAAVAALPAGWFDGRGGGLCFGPSPVTRGPGGGESAGLIVVVTGGS
jgi:hypothetical protein